MWHEATKRAAFKTENVVPVYISNILLFYPPSSTNLGFEHRSAVAANGQNNFVTFAQQEPEFVGS